MANIIWPMPRHQELVNELSMAKHTDPSHASTLPIAISEAILMRIALCDESERDDPGSH